MKLQDYAHYYIGCKVEKDLDALDYPTIKGIHGDRVMISEYRYKTPHAEGIFTRPEMYQYASYVKPLLRRLEDMPEKEGIEMFGTDRFWDIVCKEGKWDLFSSKEFHCLLQQGFDLFGLIPEGLAIDIKTITP